MTPNKRIKTSDSTHNSLPITIRVPTFRDKKVTELNLQSIEEEDLKLLKKKGKHNRVLPILLSRFYHIPINDSLSHNFCLLCYAHNFCFLCYASLCETDPFLYYSIPEVNKAALSLKEVDLSQASQSAHTVTRKARIAFECHPSVAMDELLVGSEESELDDGGFLELLYKSQ